MIGELSRLTHAELIKVRLSPSLWILLLVTMLISVGLTGLIAGFGGAESLGDVQSGETGSRYEILFFGATLGVWAFAFFGASFSAGEFVSGAIGYTFTATPRRTRVLVAKLVIVLGIGSIAGLLVSLINFAITQGVLTLNEYPTLSLNEPELLRAVLVFIPAQMAVWGALSLLLGFLIRRTAPTVIVLLLGSFLPVVTAQFLPTAWGETVPRWMPGAAIESLAGLSSPGSPGFLPASAATVAVIGWLLLFGIIGGLSVKYRDV